MNRITLIIGLCLFLGGCAWFTQAQKDVALSNATPLTANETTTTQQQAAAIGSTVTAVATVTPLAPFAAPIGGLVTLIAGWFLASSRGAQIRKSGGTVPAATSTNVNIVTGLLQDVANAFTGAFTTTTGTATTGSAVWQRVWKTLLATVVSGAGAIAVDPSLATYLTAHPIVAGALTTIPSIILGVEKALSNVPVVTTAATTAA